MERRPENTSRPVETGAPVSESKVRRPSSEGGNKNVIIILSVVAAALAVVLGYVLISKSRLVNDLQVEKDELTEQIVALQQDYAELSSDYETINAQLDSSREEVNQLVERINKTDATNRAKIRQYQKELGTLRSIMRNYIVQIDSLNTLNHKLTADAAAARQEAATAKKHNEELRKTVDELNDKVETGSVIHGRGVKAEAYNDNGKVVDRAKSTVRVMTTLSLVENNLAPKGPMRVYVVITDPDGRLLTNSESRTCNYQGNDIQTSASREVDYQGNEVELSIYMNGIPKYSKGIYNVQVLTERAILGSTQFMLR